MSAYSDLVLAHANLVVYYRLGESSGTTADDIGPNNLDGTYAGSGITYGVDGPILNDANTAVEFDQSSDPFSRADNNALDLGDGPISIELWIKRSGTQGAVQVLVGKGANAYQFLLDSSNRVALTKQGVGDVVRSTTSITDTTTWHHLVATKNGSSRAVYIDGVDVTSLLTNATFENNTGALRLGGTTGIRFDGSMADVAIYSSVLSASVVLQHYQTGRGFAVTPATETDTAQALTKRKAKTLTVATTTHTAQALRVPRLTPATETDTAGTLGRIRTIGAATETDEAQALDVDKPIHKDLTPASETDTAQALDADKQATLTPATETDEARPLSRQGFIYVTLDPATETDQAQALSYQVGSGAVGGGWALPRRRRRPLEPKPPHIIFLQSAYEVSEAVALTYRKEPNLLTEDEELLAILGVV